MPVYRQATQGLARAKAPNRSRLYPHSTGFATHDRYTGVNRDDPTWVFTGDDLAFVPWVAGDKKYAEQSMIRATHCGWTPSSLVR